MGMGAEEGVAGDDARVVSDKSLSSFAAAFSISGSLRRSAELYRKGKKEDSKRNRCGPLAEERQADRGMGAGGEKKKGEE